tara:strand:+ start:1350 stop:1619 length:270 start_codon:yes stop_codon:yes gene_type:complete
MSEIKKDLTYYEKNKDKIKKYYQKNKKVKAEYNKIYYERIKKEKRTTWEYYQYQKEYYRLKKQGMRPSDIKKKKEFIQSKNENNLVTFD